jgi:nitrogen regulatory protein P-II 1
MGDDDCERVSTGVGVMKKLEIILRPDSLERLKVLLNDYSIGGITIMSVMGCGAQRGDVTGEYKGLKIPGMNLLPKILAIVVVKDDDVDDILNIIHENISTGQFGDGKVFVSEVTDVMRIRTGERGKKAV